MSAASTKEATTDGHKVTTAVAGTDATAAPPKGIKTPIPSLVPRWRAMKQIQNDLAAFDTGIDPGGEYVQPRPAFMDPIGDVPRRGPHSMSVACRTTRARLAAANKHLSHASLLKRRRRPPAELLRHRALVRTALSTVGFRDSEKIAKAGNGGMRMCWPAMPADSLHRLRAPPTQAMVDAMRLRETEPPSVEAWKPAGSGGL